MKILVVEDSEERNVQFRKWLANHDYVIAVDAEEGLRLLHASQYDVIFLDHDLGNRSGVDSNDPNTGYTVAKQIPESINKNTQVIVHSMNVDGARNILGVLKTNNAFHRIFGEWISGVLK